MCTLPNVLAPSAVAPIDSADLSFTFRLLLERRVAAAVNTRRPRRPALAFLGVVPLALLRLALLALLDLVQLVLLASEHDCSLKT